MKMKRMKTQITRRDWIVKGLIPVNDSPLTAHEQIDGSGSEQLLKTSGAPYPSDWLGEYLLFSVVEDTGRYIHGFTRDGGDMGRLVNEVGRSAQFSPDGRWIAFSRTGKIGTKCTFSDFPTLWADR